MNAPTALDRATVFAVGDRVVVPPTFGAACPACRQGGPGEVVDVREYVGPLARWPMAYVQLDGSADVPQPYRFTELRREPTV